MRWVIIWMLISIICAAAIPSHFKEDDKYRLKKNMSTTAPRKATSTNISDDSHQFDSRHKTTDEISTAMEYEDTELNEDPGNYSETLNDDFEEYNTNNTKDYVETNWRQLTNKYRFNPYGNTRRIINNYELSKIIAESQPYDFRRLLGRLDNVNSGSNFGSGKKKSKAAENAVSNIREVREKLFDHLMNYVRGISVEDLIQNGSVSLDDKLTNYYDVNIGLNEKKPIQKIVFSKENNSERSNSVTTSNSGTLNSDDQEERHKHNRLYSINKKPNDSLEDLKHLEVTSSKDIKNYNESHNSNETNNGFRETSENYKNKTQKIKPGLNKLTALEYSRSNKTSSSANDKDKIKNINTQSRKNIESFKNLEGTRHQIKVNDDGPKNNKKNKKYTSNRKENGTFSMKSHHDTQSEKAKHINGDQLSYHYEGSNATDGRKESIYSQDKDQKEYTNQFSEHLNKLKNNKQLINDFIPSSYQSYTNQSENNQIESILSKSNQNKEKHDILTREKEIKTLESSQRNTNKTIYETRTNTTNNKELDKTNSTKLTEDDTSGRRSQGGVQGMWNDEDSKSLTPSAKDQKGRIHLHLDFEIL